MDDNILINYTSQNGIELNCESNIISLTSAEDIIIYPNSCEYINTGITLYLTDKYSGILCNRRVQAKNKIIIPDLTILNGVCSNIQVLLYNLGDNPYKIMSGYTKIANIQIIKGLALNKGIILQRND